MNTTQTQVDVGGFELEVTWQPRPGIGTLVARLPNGSEINAFWFDDPDGIWGEGYGYVATIPGTRRGVHGGGRLASLDDVVRDATKKVTRALKRRTMPLGAARSA